MRIPGRKLSRMIAHQQTKEVEFCMKKYAYETIPRQLLALSSRAVGKSVFTHIFLIVFLLVIMLDVNGFVRASEIIGTYSLLIVSIYSLVYVRRNIMLFTLFSLIAYFNYSIMIANYIKVLPTYFTSLSDDPVSLEGLIILFFFQILIVVFIPADIGPTITQRSIFVKKSQNNSFVLTAVIGFVLLYILLFQFQRPEILGARGTPEPLYEYSLVFFIVGYYFVSSRKPFKIFLSVLLGFFVLQNFAFGGRVIGLQLILAYILIFHAHRLTIIRVLPVLLVGFIILSIIGEQRAEISFSFQSVGSILDNLFEKAFALDTAYSAYFTSLTFLKTADMLTFAERLDLFLRFLLSIVFGGRVSGSVLASYTRSFYIHYFGGVLPFHLYFYLGWLGIALSAFLVRIYISIINSLRDDSGGLKKCVSVYVVVSVFRWYLYSPLGLLRGVILLSIVYLVASIVSEV